MQARKNFTRYQLRLGSAVALLEASKVSPRVADLQDARLIERCTLRHENRQPLRLCLFNRKPFANQRGFARIS
jgi:hypothetical protein